MALNFVNVYCFKTDCVFNAGEKCQNTDIEINSDGYCENYQKEEREEVANE